MKSKIRNELSHKSIPIYPSHQPDNQIVTHNMNPGKQKTDPLYQQ